MREVTFVVAVDTFSPTFRVPGFRDIECRLLECVLALVAVSDIFRVVGRVFFHGSESIIFYLCFVFWVLYCVL